MLEILSRSELDTGSLENPIFQFFDQPGLIPEKLVTVNIF